MKDWLQIGEFSSASGLTRRALRVYEEMGLLESHARGENNYRYYNRAQIDRARQIKKYKTLGFKLNEIKSLIESDVYSDPESLKNLMTDRLDSLQELQVDTKSQIIQIRKILSSFESNEKELSSEERRYVMSKTKNICVVVTGTSRLIETAQIIAHQLGGSIDIREYEGENSPGIYWIHESDLNDLEVESGSPDVVVINNLSRFDQKTEQSYLKLFNQVQSHMTTVFNADDRLSVQLAANEKIKKSRIFYYSKDIGLESQIKKIGGVVGDSDSVRIYGFNLNKKVLRTEVDKNVGFDTEVSRLAGLAAVLDVGLESLNFDWESS